MANTRSDIIKTICNKETSQIRDPHKRCFNCKANMLTSDNNLCFILQAKQKKMLVQQ